jgi:hypothetical protein
MWWFFENWPCCFELFFLAKWWHFATRKITSQNQWFLFLKRAIFRKFWKRFFFLVQIWLNLIFNWKKITQILGVKNWKNSLLGTSSLILWEVLVKSSQYPTLTHRFFLSEERTTQHSNWTVKLHYHIIFLIYVYTTPQWLNKVSS